MTGRSIGSWPTSMVRETVWKPPRLSAIVWGPGWRLRTHGVTHAGAVWPSRRTRAPLGAVLTGISTGDRMRSTRAAGGAFFLGALGSGMLGLGSGMLGASLGGGSGGGSGLAA